MEPPKTLTLLENGSIQGLTNDLDSKKEVVVTLKDAKGGVYISRFKLILFTSAFLLCMLLVVLLLTFVRQDETVRVTSHSAISGCDKITKDDNGGKTMENITVSFSDGIKNGSQDIYAENLTYPENVTDDKDEKNENKTYGILNDSTINLDREHPRNNIRLSRDFIPEHYDIQLMIDLENKTFTGSVNIILIAKKPTKYIAFHINMMQIFPQDVKVRNINTNKYLAIDQQKPYKRNQLWIIELVDMVDIGHSYMVEVRSFFAKIIRDLKGLYLSMYEEDGEVKYLAATQLQSTDARKMFPCLDEPDMKATFSMTIIHQEQYTALSNMPEETVQYLTSDPGYVKVKFKKSPRMSTYLLAVIVAEFQYKEKIFDDGYQLRVWAQPKKINQTEYALQIGEEIYEYFTDYFGINDIVPKSDHVAVPDFSGGAMENWGLVIYRETALLYDPELSSSENKLMVTLIVAHEIAHTWFGNMVTMKWWDDLWLNEGFASLLMYFAMDHIYPDWDIFNLYVVVKEVFTVMLKDALPTSHPVSTPISTPDDIAQTFDTISYSKGMAVLRMLLGFVGWEDFKQGLRLYVIKYQFKNAEMDELWDQFSEAVDHRYDIKYIMNTWTRQMGYPVITITCEGDDYVLQQSRFLLDGNSSFGAPSIYDYKWVIPFTYMTEEHSDPNNASIVWLDMGSATIPKQENSWILGNVFYTGFYRINYELSMWQSLAAQLNRDHTVFPESNRAGLIGDALNLARAQTIDYEVALNMTTYLKNEEKYVPWRAFVDSIEFIKGMISKQGSYVLLRKYLHDLVAPVFDTVGTSTSGTLPEQHMRDVMLQTACDVGVVKAINYAKEMFRKWKTEGIKLPSQYSLVIYTVGVREGSVEEWDYVWNKSKSSNVDGEREMLMDALAQSQKPWLLWRYANWIFDSSKIKMQDVRLVVSYFAKNPLGRMIALHLLMTKWERLNEQFGGDNFLLRETIGEVTQYVNTEFEYKQLERLFRDKPPKVAKKEAENALALMRANIKWMELNYATITNWLRDHVVGML
ncbi:aminopeptidase N-like [Mytilus californianus]|uniref:aminopeptidase N-like n=1 Tax=Mytilus californianus TaxID=6549 RepID=UPI0022469D0A|nr:aminopeptidase N-like [Mytilus californianus]